MSVIRLFVSDALAAGARVRPSQAQAHYLLRVMRQAPGDEVVLFNGVHGEWRGRIETLSRWESAIELVERLRPQAPGPDLDLLVAAVKRTRLETIVEKAAELGVRRIVPLVTQRTGPGQVNVERLTAIAVEASEQTGRLDVPEVTAACRLGHVLEAWPADRRLMFCDEGGEAPPAARALAAVGPAMSAWGILIGPEGGFTPEERRRVRALAAAVPVSLGPRILRADTAAIAALALWQSALGDWRGS